MLARASREINCVFGGGRKAEGKLLPVGGKETSFEIVVGAPAKQSIALFGWQQHK